MEVLSLFDGISCGQVALHRAKKNYKTYFSSEIDPYAIKVTQSNFPNTIQLGKIQDCEKWHLPKIDLLFAAPPCQGFSRAGKHLNFDDPRTHLFFEFLNILQRLQPRYFLLENVKMKQEYRDIISTYLGVQPIGIDSSLVSAQKRIRLYWTNIPNVSIPIDREVFMEDELEREVDIGDRLLAPRLAKYGVTSYDGPDVLLHVVRLPRGKNKQIVAGRTKVPTLTNSDWKNNNFLTDGVYYRCFTPIECERFQTIRDNYTVSVSDKRRYRLVGNAWTVEVIKHIIQNV